MAANPASRLIRHPGTSAGYTMVELVAVLLIIGMVATIGVARMPSPDTFTDRTIVSSVLALAAQARTTAIETECDVTMQVSATSVGLQYSGCPHNQGVARDGDGAMLSMSIDEGSFTSNGQFTFHASGRVTPRPAEITFTNNVSTVIDLMTLTEQ